MNVKICTEKQFTTDESAGHCAASLILTQFSHENHQGNLKKKKWLASWGHLCSSSDLMLDLMLCCCHLAILNNSKPKYHAFSLCTCSYKLCSQAQAVIQPHN